MIGSYDYDGLIKSFLHRNDKEGNTAQGRMSFYGNRLYSYNALLAELRTLPKSNQTALFIDKSIKNYSVTTAKQTTRLLRQNNYPVYVWYLKMNPEQNAEEMLLEIDELIKKHTKARSRKQYYKEALLKKHKEIEDIIINYSIDKRKSIYRNHRKLAMQYFAHKIL